MAKVILKASILAAALAGTALTAPAFAQQEDLMSKALAAEGQRYWQAAENFYRQMLENEPERADLWKRLADIIAEEGGRGEEAAETFARAAELSPENAALQADAAAAYSIINQPETALTYITRATRLEPGNAEYWNSRSVLEGWLGNYAAAEVSMNRAFDNGLPRSEEALVRLATLQQWQNKLVESSATLQELIAAYPDNQLQLLNLARLYSWRGNFAVALQYVDAYREAGGDPLVHAQEKSLYLAWADRPDASRAISAPALAENPDDPKLLIATAIAQQRGREFDEMFSTLDRLDEVTATSGEAQEIRRILTAHLRSNVDVRFTASTDRDDIDIAGGQAVVSYALKPGTFFRLGGESYYVNAPAGSGLDRIDGGETIIKSGGWAEIEAPLGDNVWGSAQIGGVFTDFNSSTTKVNTQLHVRASDQATFTFGYDRDLFMVSPRALSLGIVRNETFIRTVWTPSLKWYVEARGAYFWLNDNNEEWRGDLTVIRQVFRRNQVNMDIGFTGTWFGYEQDLANGYYDPGFYQRYLFPLYFYFKFSDNDGLSITISPGIQKDDSMDRFHFAGAVSFESTHGLYEDWMLKTWLSAYVGGSGSALDPSLNINDYYIVSGGLRLVRRF